MKPAIGTLMPTVRPERGQFYFAETGHFYFAATFGLLALTLGAARDYTAAGRTGGVNP